MRIPLPVHCSSICITRAFIGMTNVAHQSHWSLSAGPSFPWVDGTSSSSSSFSWLFWWFSSSPLHLWIAGTFLPSQRAFTWMGKMENSCRLSAAPHWSTRNGVYSHDCECESRNGAAEKALPPPCIAPWMALHPLQAPSRGSFGGLAAVHFTFGLQGPFCRANELLHGWARWKIVADCPLHPIGALEMESIHIYIYIHYVYICIYVFLGSV